MRVMILSCIVEMAKFTNGDSQIGQESFGLIKDLLESINDDISSLEERPVVELMQALTKIIALNPRNDVMQTATYLYKRVHDVVSDMAVENADLVDLNFIMDYLNSINVMQRRLDKDKTEAFVDMFRNKCKDESTVRYISDYMMNTKMLLDVHENFQITELDDICLKKWTDGEKLKMQFFELFQRCQSVIKAKTSDGTWSEEDQSNFVEKSLARVESLISTSRGAFKSRISDSLKCMAILEQLPQSEKRDELMQGCKDFIGQVETIKYLSKKQLL